jgi:hypothetical protein
MNTQEFKPGDAVRFRMGDSIYSSPNFPVIPMKVIKPSLNRTGLLK